MDFSVDTPIKEFDEDILHRSDFAKHFARSLVSMSGTGSFTVSLNGCWGSGKTSLLNLIKKELNYICNTDDTISIYPNIVDFAPWNTLDEDAIISQFFNAFTESFPVSKLRKIINSKITKGAIKVLENIPNIGSKIKALNSAFDKYFKCFLEEEKNLLKQKNNIVKRLEKLPLRYIVFIDDIDRLNKQEIRLLIQLMKAVCDFPNVTYVLAFDKDIVANALEDEQKVDGSAYLEKIIQLSIDLPEISQDDLRNYLVQQVNTVIKNVEDDELDKDRWYNIYKNGFGDYFLTLRSVNRYINAIKFKFPSHKPVLNVVDFLIMEGIALFEPALLSHIHDNRYLLCKQAAYGDKDSILNNFNSKAKEITTHYNILPILFPVLQTHTLGSYSSTINMHEAKARGMICYEDNFDYYFEGHLRPNALSKGQIIEILNFSDISLLNEFIKQLNNKSYNLFLQYLYGFSRDDKYIDRLFVLFPTLVETVSKFKDITTFFGFGGNSVWIRGILENIWKKYGINATIIWIKEELYHKVKDYKILTDIQYYIASGSKFYFQEEKKDTCEFTVEQIQELHDILIFRLSAEFLNKNLRFGEHAIDILYFIYRKNKELLKELYKNLIKNGQILHFMDDLVNIGYGESNIRFRTYYFNHSVFDEYVDLDNVKKDVDEFIASAPSNNINGRDLLAKILFKMPVRKDAPYTLGEVKKYCRENGINFDYEDEFVDE